VVECVVDLEGEFGPAVVAEALRRRARKRDADRPRADPGETDPLWDRDLDG
jgi:hypothetical protein